MERERNVLQRTRDAPTISILRSNTSFSTLIERLASGKFFNERKKIISSPFHFYGERNYSPTNGTTDFSLPRRGSRRELRGLLLIRTYVRDRANVSVNLRYFSRPLWPTRMVAMNLGIFLKKGKKKRKKRTYEFVSRILRGKRDDASRWKAIRGTGNVRNWKGKRSREGKVRVRIECRWRRDWLWFMARKCSHRRAHRCPAIRKNLMWRKSGRDPRPIGREILRNSSPLQPLFLIIPLMNDYHEDRHTSPVLIDLVNARLSFLNSYKMRDNYARLLIYLSFSGGCLLSL